MNIPHRSENNLVGAKMRRLLSFKSRSPVHNEATPILRNLREKRANRVKTVATIFEQEPWSLKIGCNWWINGLTSPMDLESKPLAELKFPAHTPRFNDEEKIKQIIKIEQEHVEHLEQLTARLNGVAENDGSIPRKIRDNSFCLFGDLKVIYGLHKTILPKMILAIPDGRSCVAVLTLIIQLIDGGDFYCYVNHKIQEQTINRIYNELVPQLLEQPLLDPFSILDKYHDWISDVFNELMKHPLNNADDIAICIEAEKKLMELLDVIGDAGAVSHIAQVSDISIDMPFKIFRIIKMRREVTQPMLFLVPTKSIRNGYRYPVSAFDFIPVFRF